MTVRLHKSIAAGAIAAASMTILPALAQDQVAPPLVTQINNGMLVAGAMAVIRYARQRGTKRLWIARIMERRPIKVAAVALANKMARMAWAMMVSGERFKEPTLLPAAP